MKALFGANLNSLFLIFFVIFQIQPYFVIYQCFMNKTVQNAYNIRCKDLLGGNLDGVKEIHYYSSALGGKSITTYLFFSRLCLQSICQISFHHNNENHGKFIKQILSSFLFNFKKLIAYFSIALCQLYRCSGPLIVSSNYFVGFLIMGSVFLVTFYGNRC